MARRTRQVISAITIPGCDRRRGHPAGRELRRDHRDRLLDHDHDVLDDHDRCRSHPEWATLLEIFAEASTRWAEAGTSSYVLMR